MTKRRRRARRQGRDGKHPVPPKIAGILDEGLDIDLVAGNHADIQLAMVQAVLRRMVELKLAQWTETVLLILKDEFGFNQEQLALFARKFRERSSEQATETESAPAATE
jgi:hypothetical protein